MKTPVRGIFGIFQKEVQAVIKNKITVKAHTYQLFTGIKTSLPYIQHIGLNTNDTNDNVDCIITIQTVSQFKRKRKICVQVLGRAFSLVPFYQQHGTLW